MEIRRIAPEDVAAVCSIIASHSRWDGIYARRALEREFAESRAGLARGAHIVALAEDGTVIGVSGWRESELASEGVYWLGWTYVHPERRRRGVGTALLDRVLTELRALGARKLYLDTGAAGYQDALAFYASHGFHEEARLRDYYSDGEDCLILARRL